MDWVFKSNVNANSIKDAIEFIDYSNVEPLYCLVNYIVSRFTNNISIIYFIMELIILTFVYVGFVKISKNINVLFSYCYLIFLLVFFNKSLNLCRQSIAMAICIFSLQFILSRNWKNFIIIMLLAFGFHRSAILFFPLYFIYDITTNKKMINKFICMLIIGFLIISVVMFKPLILLLVNIGILSNKYLNYVYVFGGSSNIKFFEFLTQMIILLIILYFSRNLNEKSKHNSFFVYVTILSFVTFLFGFNAKYVQRISYYYTYCIVILIAQFGNIFKEYKDKLIIINMSIIMLLTYSYLYYEKYDFDQTTPYKIDVTDNKIV